MHLLSPHADRHAGDISFTVCFYVSLFAGYFVSNISGVSLPRMMKFGRMVDLGG